MVHEIFDRSRLLQNRLRARKYLADEDFPHFLFERITDDLELRLSGINRQFEKCLYLGHQSDVVTKMLLSSGKVGSLVISEPAAALLEKNGEMQVVCDEEKLPFKNAEFDLCVSALGLQFVNDLPGSLLQIHNLLKPDGLFLGVMAGGNTLHELRDVLLQYEAEKAEGVSPRVSPFSAVRDLGGLLQRAGFTLPVVDGDAFNLHYPHLFALVKDLRGLGAGNNLVERDLKPVSKQSWFEIANLYASLYPAENGRIEATCELIYLTGWRHHESQQKPLSPGEGRVSLEAAVRKEIKNDEG